MTTRGRNADKATLVMRENRAVELRVSGATYEEIGIAMGCTPSTAYRTVMRALTRTQVERVEELRAVESARLDRMHQALWPRAIEADAASVDRVLKIMERRARLLGLDTPRRITVDTAQIDQEIEALLAELADLAGGPAKRAG